MRENDENNFIENIELGISYLITVDIEKNELEDNYKIIIEYVFEIPGLSLEVDSLSVVASLYNSSCR